MKTVWFTAFRRAARYVPRIARRTRSATACASTSCTRRIAAPAVIADRLAVMSLPPCITRPAWIPTSPATLIFGVSLDAILAMPIPPHGLRWLSILSKPRFAPLQTAVCLSCHEGNCQQARQSSLLALAQACCERWHGVFPAITSILIHSSTYRLIYGLWFRPLPQPHRSRYWARGPRISLIIKWRRKPGDRLLLAVPRRRYDVR